MTREEYENQLVAAMARRSPARPRQAKVVEGTEHKESTSPTDHPAHYNRHPSGVECIDVVQHMGFNVGNAIKYLWRADHKGKDIEDLEKAKRYIEFELERRKK